MEPYTRAIYGREDAKRYTTGMAVHWYGSTLDCFPETLDRVHEANPDKTIFHSEGCIDNLGCEPWDGVTEPIGFKESGWFNNDAFWWDTIATDWAYSTQWAGDTHPKYVAVHRYARYIINGLNHWLTGFIDWNIVLDSIGGPNHVNNFAAAPVMVDYSPITNNQLPIIYFTPYYYVLKQFSRSMRPGDVVLAVNNQPAINNQIYLCAVEKQDGSYAINILNTGKEATFPLQIGDYVTHINIPANAVETIIVRL